jgi:YjbE family integral membrane protein
MFSFDASSLGAFLQVIMIDLVLAGDNAIVIGLAAAGLEKSLRQRAILIGIAAATVMRIGFALVAQQLLTVTGLVLAGGLLLLWVCWKMWKELKQSHADDMEAAEALANADINADGTVGGRAPRKTLGQAVWQIVIADVSMSLDNVLAVSAAAMRHPEALVFGLGLSVVMMGVAASYIAKLLNRFRWIGWVGFAIILFVAVRMVYEGADEVLGHALPVIPFLKTAVEAVQ